MMDESVLDVQQALAEAGASWEGLAGESMQAGVAPLSQWAQDAGTAGNASNDSVRVMSESFSYTANAMPEPAREPVSKGFFADVLEGQNDRDRRDRENQQAKQRAVELMQSYSRGVDSAVSGVGTFVPPQSATVSVPPGQPFSEPKSEANASIPGPPAGPRGSAGPEGEPERTAGPSAAVNPAQGGPPTQTPLNASPVPGPGPGLVNGEQPTAPGSAGPSAPHPGHLPADRPRDVAIGRPPLSAFETPPGYPTARPNDPTTGRPVGSGGRPTSGPQPGEPERGRGADEGRRTIGRGALTGSTPLEGERAAAGRGGVAGSRGVAGGPGMAPVGAGAPREEDAEHFSPDYLRDYHDEFWDDTPPLAPEVIGVDNDPPPSDKEG